MTDSSAEVEGRGNVFGRPVVSQQQTQSSTFITHTADHYRAVLLGFGCEGIANDLGLTPQEEILARVLRWLGPCLCGVPGDLDCSDSVNPLDVVYLVNYVYLSQDAMCGSPDCPFPVGDLNCDDGVDPLDVTYLVNAVYKFQDGMCDGCQ